MSFTHLADWLPFECQGNKAKLIIFFFYPVVCFTAWLHKSGNAGVPVCRMGKGHVNDPRSTMPTTHDRRGGGENYISNQIILCEVKTARQPAAAQWLIAVMLTSIRVKLTKPLNLRAFQFLIWCIICITLIVRILHSFHQSPNIKLISQQNYQIYMAIIPCKWPLNTNFAALVTCWDWCIHCQLLDPLNPHGGTASS